MNSFLLPFILCCYSIAFGQEISSISKKTFLEGRFPYGYKKSSLVYLKPGKGVVIMHCSYFKNNYNEKSYFTFNSIGITNTSPIFAVVEKVTYNGHEFIITNTTSCERYLFNGYPYQLADKIICFNESRTTDRVDKIFIYQINKKGKIILKKAILLSLAQMHLDGVQNVRFSVDGKYLFYKSLNNYYACAIE